MQDSLQTTRQALVELEALLRGGEAAGSAIKDGAQRALAAAQALHARECETQRHAELALLELQAAKRRSAELQWEVRGARAELAALGVDAAGGASKRVAEGLRQVAGQPAGSQRVAALSSPRPLRLRWLLLWSADRGCLSFADPRTGLAPAAGDGQTRGHIACNLWGPAQVLTAYPCLSPAHPRLSPLIPGLSHIRLGPAQGECFTFEGGNNLKRRGLVSKVGIHEPFHAQGTFRTHRTRRQRPSTGRRC